MLSFLVKHYNLRFVQGKAQLSLVLREAWDRTCVALVLVWSGYSSKGILAWGTIRGKGTQRQDLLQSDCWVHVRLLFPTIGRVLYLTASKEY